MQDSYGLMLTAKTSRPKSIYSMITFLWDSVKSKSNQQQEKSKQCLSALRTVGQLQRTLGECFSAVEMFIMLW